MMTINPNTGYLEAKGRSPRFTMWTAFLVFTTIVMGSSIQVKNNVGYGEEVPASSKYAVACSVVTFIATVLAVIVHFIPSAAVLFVGTQIEGAVIVVLVAFWTAIVSIVTDASNGLVSPEDSSSAVQNANLYYFGWAGFFTAVMLAIEYGRAVFSVDAAGAFRDRAPRLALWSAMICTAIVIMGSSARVVRNDCNGPLYKQFPIAYCARARLGVATGTIGVLVAIGVVISKVMILGIPLFIEAGFAAFLTLLNTFGVGYITSPAGPGSAVGNLYYFSWGSFLLSAFIVFNCFGEYSGHNAASTDPTVPVDPSSSNQPRQNKDGDIEVETFEDNNI